MNLDDWVVLALGLLAMGVILLLQVMVLEA